MKAYYAWFFLGLLTGMFLVALVAAIQAAWAQGWLWAGIAFIGVWVFSGHDY